MSNKLIIAFVTVALAIASAANKYTITISQPCVVDGNELKAGEYKVEVVGDKAIFKLGKKTVEVPVIVRGTEAKVDSNTVRYAAGNKLEEIRLGGTRTRLIFDRSIPETPADAR